MGNIIFDRNPDGSIRVMSFDGVSRALFTLNGRRAFALIRDDILNESTDTESLWQAEAAALETIAGKDKE